MFATEAIRKHDAALRTGCTAVVAAASLLLGGCTEKVDGTYRGAVTTSCTIVEHQGGGGTLFRDSRDTSVLVRGRAERIQISFEGCTLEARTQGSATDLVVDGSNGPCPAPSGFDVIYDEGTVNAAGGAVAADLRGSADNGTAEVICSLGISADRVEH